ncbi:MAG: hypothetical protein QGF62_06180, partial [Gammaproteobacteria bacterium]|nr:hypothetical protein [Gammaproteobacteria bacterium]
MANNSPATILTTGKTAECLRVGAEGVVTLNFAGEPPLAHTFVLTTATSPPNLFHDGLGLRVGQGLRISACSNFGVQANTLHHARHASGRGTPHVTEQCHGD